MGLTNQKTDCTFVNISKGKLYTKKSGEEPTYYNALEGIITGISIRDDEYNGNKFEVLYLEVTDSTDVYVLQVRVDSGYFRTLCNALKSANLKEPVSLQPFYAEENGKPKTVLFVKQNKKSVKFFHTKDNMGDLPPMEKVVFKGKEQWDGSKQLIYWKNWLNSLKIVSDYEKVRNDADTLEIPNDLPF